MTSVTETLHTLATLLDQLAIEYAVMGGFAVRAYGVPRPTYDIDLAIAADREDLPRLFEKLREYDFEVPEAYEKGWVDRLRDMPLFKLRRYLGDKSLDADLFLVETKFLKEVMTRRSSVDADGAKLWVVGPEDLVLLKLLAGRPRDIGDIHDIFFMQGQLDIAYLQLWGAALGIADELKSLLAEIEKDRP